MIRRSLVLFVAALLASGLGCSSGPASTGGSTSGGTARGTTSGGHAASNSSGGKDASSGASGTTSSTAGGSSSGAAASSGNSGAQSSTAGGSSGGATSAGTTTGGAASTGGTTAGASSGAGSTGGAASSGGTTGVNAGVQLPIKDSGNGRYFVDSAGTPWLMVGDAAHHLMPAVPQSAWTAYLADRVSHGFNTINFFAMCSGGGTCPSNGAAYDGTLPFATGTDPGSYDLSTPNPAYWSEVDTFISEATGAGFVVLFDPIPWGMAFGPALQNNGPTKDYAFGQFVGNRYKNTPGIVWQAGQDFQSWSSSASDLNDEAQLMAGIASADPNHLISAQLDYDESYSTEANASNATFAASLTANFVYTYYEPYDEVLKAYAASPALPIFLGETNYETGNNTGDLSSAANAFITRLEMWYPTTSGASGFVFGNEHVNHFDSSYPQNLDTAATGQVQYVAQLLGTLPWWNLVPDTAHAVVTAGYGTPNGGNLDMYQCTYATTTADASHAVTYTPVAATLTVNLGAFSGPVGGTWYDPTTGVSTPIAGSPFTNAGSQTFTTPPAAHADGTNDWVLVLE